MKTIEIKTKKQWEKLPKSFKEETHIKINLNSGEIIDIEFIPTNSYVDVFGSSQIGSMNDSSQIRSMHGSSQIGSIHGSSQIRSMLGSSQIGSMNDSSQIGSIHGLSQIRSMYDSSQIRSIHGLSQIRSMYDSSQIGSMNGSSQIGSIHGSSQIRSMYDSSQIRSMYDSSQIGSMYGSSQIGSIHGLSQIRSIHGFSQIRSMYGSSQIGSMHDSSQIRSMYDSSQIRSMYGSSQIGSMHDSSQIRSMYDNTIVRISSKNCVINKCIQNSILIIYNKCRPTVNINKSTVPIIFQEEISDTLESFCDKYEENMKNKNSIYLYKVVRDDYTDFWTGNIKYEGIVECPDFDSDVNRPCGGGLHLSPTSDLALTYNDGKVLKCEVKLKDIIVYPKDISKVRCRKVKVVEEIEK